jgi:hypothetical protein
MKMQHQNQSVTCRTASGGSGSFGRLGQIDQQVAKRVQILDGSYNAGSYYSFGVNAPISKQYRWVWPLVRKSQRRKCASDRDIETPDAKCFWHIVRINYLRMLRLFGH